VRLRARTESSFGEEENEDTVSRIYDAWLRAASCEPQVSPLRGWQWNASGTGGEEPSQWMILLDFKKCKACLRNGPFTVMSCDVGETDAEKLALPVFFI